MWSSKLCEIFLRNVITKTVGIPISILDFLDLLIACVFIYSIMLLIFRIVWKKRITVCVNNKMKNHAKILSFRYLWSLKKKPKRSFSSIQVVSFSSLFFPLQPRPSFNTFYTTTGFLIGIGLRSMRVHILGCRFSFSSLIEFYSSFSIFTRKD